MPPTLPLSTRSALLLSLLLAACGGGGDDAAPAPETAQVVAGRSVLRLQGAGSAHIGLAQRARPIEENTTPDRVLLLPRPAAPWVPPAGWALIDAAWHPSGAISVVLASATALRLLRLDATGRVHADTLFADPLADTDPITGDVPFVTHAGALLPRPTRDAVRLAATGDDLVMALRTGRHAVVAYGLRLDATAGFVQRWRTLVEPGVAIDAVIPLSGSFDPFGSIEKQWHVALAAADDGRVAVAVSLGRSDTLSGHNRHFGETWPADTTDGALLTRLAADGRRLGSTLLASAQRAELHGLRWASTQLVLFGRVRTQQTDAGWDGWIAWAGADDGAVQRTQVLDVDRGDVVLDAAPLGDGRWLLAGSTGYLQNPTGVSISESAAPLLALLPAPGQAAQRLPLDTGPRHNQARSLAWWDGRWWAGGMADGPGTHSADADPALLRADGWLRALSLPAR